MTTKRNMQNERTEIQALVEDVADDLSPAGMRIECDCLIDILLAAGGYRGQHLRDRRQELDAIADRAIVAVTQ